MDRAVFLDRDGTITKSDGYVCRREQLDMVGGLAGAIKLLNRDFLVIIITNQPVVARGLCTEEDVKQLHDEIVGNLAREGARVDAVYFCPHHPDMHGDVPEHARKYRIDCGCRKPKTGMLEQAARDFDIDVRNSFFIGDSTRDIQTAKNAGCVSVLVKTGQRGGDGKYGVKPDFVFESLPEAAKFISPKIKAVILAGGKGERLMPLTGTMPKPMIDVAGRPVLEWQINALKNQGIKEIILCGSHLVGKIKDCFGGGKTFGVKIHYPDEPEQLGSGGAVKNAEAFLKGADHFVILSGDIMLDRVDFSRMLLFHLKKGGLATVLVRESDHPVDSDILELDENQRVVGYIGRGQNKYKTANVGIMIAKSGLLDFIPEGVSSIEKDIVFKLLDTQDVYAFNKPDIWFTRDIGTPERLAAIRGYFERGE